MESINQPLVQRGAKSKTKLSHSFSESTKRRSKMAETRWQFPLIDPNKYWDTQHYVDHIREEIREYEEESDLEKKAKECMDVLHAAETLVRKFFQRNPEVSYDRIRDAIVQKNMQRGYYGRGDPPP